jgi:hypothetical protein
VVESTLRSTRKSLLLKGWSLLLTGKSLLLNARRLLSPGKSLLLSLRREISAGKSLLVNAWRLLSPGKSLFLNAGRLLSRRKSLLLSEGRLLVRTKTVFAGPWICRAFGANMAQQRAAVALSPTMPFGAFSGKESFEGTVEMLNDRGATLLKTTGKFKGWQS